mmetsp:Transcript_8555/g.21376  ORF Transcript_8555/g.21376 Transcript_8555/m.21376 type:complete len:344 (-) Transcript_8555:3038-4069(-)
MTMTSHSRHYAVLMAVVVAVAASVATFSPQQQQASSSSSSFFFVRADDDSGEPKVFCTVCSNGNVAMGAGSIGGELCQDLDKMGRAEVFTREECNIIQSGASVAPDDPCECDDPVTIRPSPHPTVGRLTPEPTPVPTQSPTAAPTPRPTPWPTPVPTTPPTPSPTANPTATPTANPTATPTENRFPCNICRDGGVLTNPSGTLVSFLGTPIFCGTAQFVGGVFGIGFTLEQCAIAQAAAIGVCGCPNEPTPAPIKTHAGGTPTTPVNAPVLAPSVAAAAAAADPLVFCLICPMGQMSMGTNAIGGMQCQDVDMMGTNRELTESECLAAQIRAAQPDDPCGCLL